MSNLQMFGKKFVCFTYQAVELRVNWKSIRLGADGGSYVNEYL